MPAPRVSMGPGWRSKMSTSAPIPRRSIPAHRPPMEPPTIRTRRSRSADMAGCGIAGLRHHDLCLECPGEDGDAANQNSRDARDAEAAGLGLLFRDLRRTLIAFESGA